MFFRLFFLCGLHHRSIVAILTAIFLIGGVSICLKKFPTTFTLFYLTFAFKLLLAFFRYLLQTKVRTIYRVFRSNNKLAPTYRAYRYSVLFKYLFIHWLCPLVQFYHGEIQLVKNIINTYSAVSYRKLQRHSYSIYYIVMKMGVIICKTHTFRNYLLVT